MGKKIEREMEKNLEHKEAKIIEKKKKRVPELRDSMRERGRT